MTTPDPNFVCPADEVVWAFYHELKTTEKKTCQVQRSVFFDDAGDHNEWCVTLVAPYDDLRLEMTLSNASRSGRFVGYPHLRVLMEAKDGSWDVRSVVTVSGDDVPRTWSEISAFVSRTVPALMEECERQSEMKRKKEAERAREKEERKQRGLSGYSTHLELLNDLRVQPEVAEGSVVDLVIYDEDDECRSLTDEELSFLELSSDDFGCVEEHPEGADRGGYVPTLSNGCYFCEVSNEWFG